MTRGARGVGDMLDASTCKPLVACRPACMVLMTERAKVGPHESEVRTVGNGLDVVGVGRATRATLDAAMRVRREERIAQGAPVGIVTALVRGRSVLVFDALPFAFALFTARRQPCRLMNRRPSRHRLNRLLIGFCPDRLQAAQT